MKTPEAVAAAAGSDEAVSRSARPDFLLHTCCGPCACGCVGTLAAAGHRPRLFFSNSNLCDRAEYERRLEAAGLLAAHCRLELTADPYDHEAWLASLAVLPGFREEPERGRRCRLCFAFSLRRAADAAARIGAAGVPFATSLSVSPHKDAAVLFAEGARFPAFEPWDFKQSGGFQESLRLSRALGMYRQRFCGCEFSRR